MERGEANKNKGNFETNSSYPMQVWLTALFLIAPLCLWIEDRINYGNIQLNSNDLFGMPLLGLGGAVLSLPLYLILFLVFRFLTRKQVPAAHVKWILNILCVPGIFITFKLVDESLVLVTPVCYSVSVIVASLFFKIYSTSTIHLIQTEG
jgi:hypothetical protein